MYAHVCIMSLALAISYPIGGGCALSPEPADPTDCQYEIILYQTPTFSGLEGLEVNYMKYLKHVNCG